MCKIGDIVLINNPIREGVDIGRHSFVVIDDQKGTITGLDFDFVGLVMSSMDTDEKKKKLMKYKGNYPIEAGAQQIVSGGNGKEACIKADQFYYFDKSKISYKVLGNLDVEVFNDLINFIQEIGQAGLVFEQIVDNT